MCEPATAMAIASAGSKYMEHENAVANYDNVTTNNYNNRVRAVSARNLSISQAQVKNEQEQGVIADKKFNNIIAAMKNTETYKTASGEDNIIGRSIDQALGMRVAEGLRNDSKLSTQSDMINKQAEMDRLEIEARLDGRLAQIVDPNPPSVAEALIGMGTAAVSGANSIDKGTTWGDVFA